LRPAEAADLTFGMGPDGKPLDYWLREETYAEEDALPLLQFTLYELYLRRVGKELTHSAYREIGGLPGSIAKVAEAILTPVAARSEYVVSRVFRSLVAIDETGTPSRRYAPMAEIERDATQFELIRRLVDARLCVADRRDGEPVVAFAHDSMLRT